MIKDECIFSFSCQHLSGIDIIISNMNNLWSIRMRASKKVRSQKSEVRKSKKKNQKSKLADIHISGADYPSDRLFELKDHEKHAAAIRLSVVPNDSGERLHEYIP